MSLKGFRSIQKFFGFRRGIVIALLGWVGWLSVMFQSSVELYKKLGEQGFIKYYLCKGVKFADTGEDYKTYSEKSLIIEYLHRGVCRVWMTALLIT